MSFLSRLKDGTIKQFHPFTGAEVWTVPERLGRPATNLVLREPELLETHQPENYCSFCEGLQRDTTPERSRSILQKGKYRLQSYLPPKAVLKHPAEFRRISNLFEIVSYDYWKKNYDFKLSNIRRKWMEDYLLDPAGARHVKEILQYRHRCQGKSEEWINKNVLTRWREFAESLFGGSHELVIARRHYTKDACFTTDLAASGELTTEEHFQFIRFILLGIEDIYKNNPHVQYASIFQNWLLQAGASFDHLHTQIVGLDESGVVMEKILKVLSKKPAAFTEYYLKFCLLKELVVAENEYAVCLAGFGERYPTLIVLSKAGGVSPWELRHAEIRGMSDMVHAAHAAMGSEIPCNEEWFFTPRESAIPVPWHTLLKWRVNNPAGFEGNTEIFINTIDPWQLKARMVPLLLEARRNNKIANIQIGEECRTDTNCLQYALTKKQRKVYAHTTLQRV